MAHQGATADLLGSPAMTRTDVENQTPAASRLRTAWGLASAGSLLLAVGPLLGVVDGPAPAYLSWPLLAVLALLPPAVAGVLWLRGRPFVAAALLAAVGAFAPGRLLGDLQIVSDRFAVGRPELFRPAELLPIATAPGLWLLVLGHVLVLAGGVLAAGRAGVPADEEDTPRRLAIFLPLAALAAIALLGEPFTSSDPFLLARGPWELPALGLVGGLLLAVAAPLVAALAGSSPDPDTRLGGLLGVALALIAITAPSLVAGLVTDGLGVTWGPVVALIAAALLVALSVRDMRDVQDVRDVRVEKKEEPTDEVALPALNRLHATAGAFALLAAMATIAGAIARQLVVIGDEPEFFASRLLWPTGLVLGLLSLMMFARGIAGAVRPALIYAVYAVLLASIFSVQAVAAASQSGLAEPGLGFWLMVAATPFGLIAVVCAAVAGAVERENAEPRRAEQTPIAELGARAAGRTLRGGRLRAADDARRRLHGTRHHQELRPDRLVDAHRRPAGTPRRTGRGAALASGTWRRAAGGCGTARRRPRAGAADDRRAHRGGGGGSRHVAGCGERRCAAGVSRIDGVAREPLSSLARSRPGARVIDLTGVETDLTGSGVRAVGAGR